MGHIFYIMGKSATGKDHLYRALLQEKKQVLHPLVLYTTRPMRAGEINGREYHFIDEEALALMRRQGKIIEERVYQTVYGPWYYATADDGSLCLEEQEYLGIGTLESFSKIAAYFGKKLVIPLYIETEDGLRLERALKREKKQDSPKYAELCRRFLADSEDFSEEKLEQAGILKRFENNGELQDCLERLRCEIATWTEERHL